jgi:hypothetical protein
MAVPKTALKCATCVVALSDFPSAVSISPSSTEAPPAPHFSTMSVGSVLLLLPAPWSARAPSLSRSPSASRSDLRVWCVDPVSPSPAPSLLALPGPSQHEEPLGAPSQEQERLLVPSPTSLSDLPGVVRRVDYLFFAGLFAWSLARPRAAATHSTKPGAALLVPLCLYRSTFSAPFQQQVRRLRPPPPCSVVRTCTFPVAFALVFSVGFSIPSVLPASRATKARAATQLVLMHLSPPGANSRSLAGQPARH